MKILHITDSHGTVKGPESRKDIYYVSFLKKFYELGYVIKKYNIDMVIHTGDLFHTARVSDKFAGQVASLINAFGVPVYVVPGNHDIEGYTTDTIDQTKLGLLDKTKTVTILDRDRPLQIVAKQGDEEFTIAISGQEYYAHIDEGNQTDFDMEQDEADLNILAIHGYLTPDAQHPNIKHTMASSITTNADIILAGHYHRQFEYNGAGFEIYNPGSLMRVDQTEYNKTHTPQYGILDITLNDQDEIVYDYSFHQLAVAQPSTTIFDYDSTYKQKASTITLDGFKNSLSNSMPTNSVNTNILQIIDNICLNAQVEAKIKKLAMGVYSDTLQCIPDEFEAQPGYIESPVTKKLSSIELTNFQSHEHSVINLTDGLNIIIGESNSGKTTIFRAILWVVDNQPLGTDFIMAGKDNCSVQLNYTDGTYIRRSRTLKDTGSYEIAYLDEQGNLTSQSYRGFTNAVPVEVANVHQMPKVNITKDLETHLNVITQLEGPFLLTESPMVKAAAIGRITGTHVIDRAIKEQSSIITGNKKLIKAYTKDLTDKDYELKQLPDIALMQSFYDAYKLICEEVERLDKFVAHTVLLKNNIENCNQQIAIQQIECDKAKAVAELAPVVNQGVSTLQFIRQSQSIYDNYNTCIANIESEEKALNINKTIASLRPIVSCAVTCKNDIGFINHAYETYITSLGNINKAVEYVHLFDTYSKTLSVAVNHANSLNSYIQQTEPILKAIEQIDAQKTAAAHSISTTKKQLKKIKSVVEEAKADRDIFIIENHLCPCCGQTINETHTQSITEFMKN